MDSQPISDDIEQAEEQAEQAIDQMQPVERDTQTFIEQFDLTVGRTQVYDPHSETYHWLWKAVATENDETHEAVSGTIFDAVMNVIEDVSGGEV